MNMRSLGKIVGSLSLLAATTFTTLGCSSGHNPSTHPQYQPSLPTVTRNWLEEAIPIGNKNFHLTYSKDIQNVANYRGIPIAHQGANVVHIVGEDANITLVDNDGDFIPEFYRFYGEHADYRGPKQTNKPAQYPEWKNLMMEVDNYHYQKFNNSYVVWDDVESLTEEIGKTGLQPRAHWSNVKYWDIFD